MTVKTSEIETALRNGLFEVETIVSPADALGHFTAGQFSGTELGANEAGVVGTIEVGADQPIADSMAVFVGQFLAGHPATPFAGDAGDKFIAGRTRRARPQIDVELTGGGEPSGQVSVALAGAKHEQDQKPKVMHSRHENEVDMNDSNVDVTDIEPLTPLDAGLRAVAEAEFINLVIENGDTAQTFDMNDIECRIPVIKWDGKGL